MLARLTALLILLAALLAGCLPAWAEVPLGQALSALGVPAEITLSDGRTLQARLEGGKVVYGTPENVIGAEPAQEFRDGQWRYLGYTYTGDPFSNMDFPPDALLTRRADRQWVQNPWDPPYGLCTENPRTIPATSWDLILRGLREQARYREDPLPDYVLEALDRYAKVLCPPVTAQLPDGTWVTTGGAVRMWHASGSWYETFFIDPLEFLNRQNLVVRNLTLDPNPASPGEAVAARAEIVNEGSQDVTTVARWIFNDQVAAEQEVWIPAGGYNVTQVHIQAPQEPGTYAVGVLANPNQDRPPNEANWDDNYAEDQLWVVEQWTPPPGCEESRPMRQYYRWYHEHVLFAVKHEAWSDYYTHRLEVEADLDTGFGPGEAWFAGKPWSKPWGPWGNEIQDKSTTKAGYALYVAAKTMLVTDYETASKRPRCDNPRASDENRIAPPNNDPPPGPSKVIAHFPFAVNVNGKWVYDVEMVPDVPDPESVRNRWVSWKLPANSAVNGYPLVFPDYRLPDGDYTITIEVPPCGWKGKLCASRQMVLKVRGSAVDDFWGVPTRGD